MVPIFYLTGYPPRTLDSVPVGVSNGTTVLNGPYAGKLTFDRAQMASFLQRQAAVVSNDFNIFLYFVSRIHTKKYIVTQQQVGEQTALSS